MVHLSLILLIISTLISQSAMDLFSSLFVVGTIIRIFRNSDFRQHVLRPTGFELLALVWIAATGLSLFLNKNFVTHPQWYKLLDFRWLILAWLTARYLSFEKWTANKIWKFSIPLALCSTFAILVFFLKFNPITPHQAMDTFPGGTVRTGGFLQQPIVFAQLYALWLMPFLALFIYGLPRQLEWIKLVDRSPLLGLSVLIATLLTGTAILLSFTRGVWLSVFIATAVLIGLRRWLWSLVTILVVGAGTWGLATVWPVLQDRLLQAFQGGDTERIWIWKANLKMWSESPWFGVGYNQNVELLPKYFNIVGAPDGLLISHAHNQFIHILSGTGIIGLIAYLAFWLYLLAVCISLFFRTSCLEPERMPSRSILAMGLTGTVLEFLAGGLFESNFEHAKIRLTMSIIVGLIIWLKDTTPQDSITESIA